MKKTLFTILIALFCLSAQAQHTYIECSDVIILSTGSIEKYDAPDIYIDGTYRTLSGTVVVTLQVAATGATTAFAKTYEIEFTDAEIVAFTETNPPGSTVIEDFKNIVLQAVADYLSALNPSVTFTLH